MHHPKNKHAYRISDCPPNQKLLPLAMSSDSSVTIGSKSWKSHNLLSFINRRLSWFSNPQKENNKTLRSILAPYPCVPQPVITLSYLSQQMLLPLLPCPMVRPSHKRTVSGGKHCGERRQAERRVGLEVGHEVFGGYAVFER